MIIDQILIKSIMRLKTFDCARGIAALIVLLYHIPLVFEMDNVESFAYTVISFPGKFGEQSVYFFMGISGYVLVLALNKFGHINFFTWSIWRIIRLLPIYYFCYFAAYLFIEDANIRLIDLTHLYIFSNNYIYSGVNPPLWSLSVEVLISLLLYPLLLPKTNPKLLLVVAISLFLSSYLSGVWGIKAILRSMSLFLVGVAAVSLNFRLSKKLKITTVFLVIFWSILILVDERILNGLLIPIILAILILLKSNESMLLVNRITIFLGKYSFSLYATHWITLNLINFYVTNIHWVLIYLLSCFFSLLIAVLVGKLIEIPTQKLSSIFIHRFKAVR